MPFQEVAGEPHPTHGAAMPPHAIPAPAPDSLPVPPPQQAYPPSAVPTVVSQPADTAALSSSSSRLPKMTPLVVGCLLALPRLQQGPAIHYTPPTTHASPSVVPPPVPLPPQPTGKAAMIQGPIPQPTMAAQVQQVPGMPWMDPSGAGPVPGPPSRRGVGMDPGPPSYGPPQGGVMRYAHHQQPHHQQPYAYHPQPAGPYFNQMAA